MTEMEQAFSELGESIAQARMTGWDMSLLAMRRLPKAQRDSAARALRHRARRAARAGDSLEARTWKDAARRIISPPSI